MELAEAIFRVGVGVGVLMVGAGLVVAALTLRPLVRDARALARDAARLSRAVEEELPELLHRAATVVADAERLTADVAVRLEQLRMVDPVPGHPVIGSVQSANAEEGEHFA